MQPTNLSDTTNPKNTVKRISQADFTQPWDVICDDDIDSNLKWYAARTYNCRERAVAKSFTSQIFSFT